MNSPSFATQILGGLLGREVRPGDFVTVPVDRIMVHDGSGPVVAATLRQHGVTELRGRERAVVVFDHFYPPTSLREAELHSESRAFALAYGIPLIQGEGIAHQVLPERGLVAPGTVLVGGDSHTCTGGALGAFATGMGATDVAAVLATGRLWLEVPETLRVRLEGALTGQATTHDLVLTILGRVGIAGALGKSIDFVGPAVPRLPMEARFKIANHAVEMGAVAGIFGIDKVAQTLLEQRQADLRRAAIVRHDETSTDADIVVDLGAVVPSVALPSLPDRVTALEAAAPVKVHQVFIGSCSGGRIEDLRAAAAVLRGRRVAVGVRLLVGPASNEALQEASKDGTLASLLAAGATILPPGCGSCLGRIGTLGDGDVAVATQNRNFIGRAGSSKSRLYLASPTSAAWAAVQGQIGGQPASAMEGAYP